MYTETRKNFVLKLLAFFKRDIEAKLISGRLIDDACREKVLGWSSEASDKTPAIVKITLGEAEIPLAIISFERLSEDVEEFEVIEELERSKSQTYFGADSINCILPDLPLVCRSMLTNRDITMTVEETLTKASNGAMQMSSYKHRNDKLIYITVYKAKNIAQLLKEYSKNKLKEEVTLTLDPRNTDITATQEELDLLISLTDTTQTQRLQTGLKNACNSSLDLLNLSSNSASHRDSTKLLKTITSKKSTIQAVHEIDSHMLQTDEKAVIDIRDAVKEFIASYEQDEFSKIQDSKAPSQHKRLSNILIIH